MDQPAGIRINKFLSEIGYCSRRAADKLIEQRRVKINGQVPEMGTRVTDEILEQFAIVATPAEVTGKIKERWGGTIDRVLCSFPFAEEADRAGYMEELRAA